MQALLDECLPTVLRLELPEHDIRVVRYMGWSGIDNGELLQLMLLRDGFDVFITIDQNLRFQQNVRASGIAVIELGAPSNRLESLLRLCLHCARHWIASNRRFDSCKSMSVPAAL